MKNWRWVGLAAVALVPMAGAAKEFSLAEWLQVMEAKIRRTEVKYQSESTAVAAVRGAKAAQTGLYWKGKKQPLTAEELAAFKTAVAFAQAGKTSDAQTALKNFLTKYPAGSLAEDAKKTLALLTPPENPVKSAGLAVPAK